MLQRRKLLGSGVVLAAVAVIAETVSAEQHDMKGMGAMDGMAMPMKDCIGLCLNSHRTCIETASYAIKSEAMRADLFVMLTDCAEMCQTTANSMIRNSLLHGILCRACAEACERCADACSQHAGDAQMVACTQTCRTCAQSCRDMAAKAH